MITYIITAALLLPLFLLLALYIKRQAKLIRERITVTELWLMYKKGLITRQEYLETLEKLLKPNPNQ